MVWLISVLTGIACTGSGWCGMLLSGGSPLRLRVGPSIGTRDKLGCGGPGEGTQVTETRKGCSFGRWVTHQFWLLNGKSAGVKGRAQPWCQGQAGMGWA